MEQLWCCHYAKERPVDDVISISISALSFDVSKQLFQFRIDDDKKWAAISFRLNVFISQFNMRYHGAGVDCKTPNNPEWNNLGRGW